MSVADGLFAEGRSAIARLSSFLVFLANIHVARHVDIDGISQESGRSSENDLYTQTVKKARLLVRTLETTAQGLYDDGSALFLAIQGIRHLETGQLWHERNMTHDHLLALTTSLKANMRVVHQTLEALLSVGHDQADMSQGDYNGSIEWRMSRLSIVHNQFGGAVRPPSHFSERPYESEGEDVVDFALAFRPPGTRSQDNGDSSRNDSTSHHESSLASESTLDHSQSTNSDEATWTSGLDPSKSTLVEQDSPDLPPSDMIAEAEANILLDDDSRSSLLSNLLH